ncbi:hypothetical protein SAMN04487939_103143 [Lysobacter sp. yr284]|uniref:hypothetical protein n=1 Tax=Lysobacter sp. yr284 TaxID=1761791 RepID=UPI000894F5A7|nr:hypothetical protein [Lysobacter sp. yr284]SDY55210.1 hypothetical protein SAMN04487939_103143 [Lysobacter sp. yr284]
MKTLAFATLVMFPLFAAAQAGAAPSAAPLQRDVRWIDAHDRSLVATQLLTRRGDGALVYRYDRQATPARRYHERMCELVGGAPAAGETVLGSADAAGSLACTLPAAAAGTPGVIVDGLFHPSPRPPANAAAQAGHAARADASDDFAHAAAPGGAAPRGENFQAVGGAGYSSETGGTGSAKTSLDNDRCTIEQTTPVPAGGSESVILLVTCIEQNVRALPTYTRACMNTTCVTETGFIDVLDLSPPTR